MVQIKKQEKTEPVYHCSCSLARDILQQKEALKFVEIFNYIKSKLWDEWRESNSHLTEDELVLKKCGELSKLLTYDTNFVYDSLNDTWSLVGEVDEELSKE